MVEIVKPYKTVGIIGGDLEAYHLAKVAKSLGFEVGVLTNKKDAYAQTISDWSVEHRTEDFEAYREFGEKSDFIIYTDDSLDINVLNYLQDYTEVPQGELLLNLAQDRLLQNAFFESMNLNILPYQTVFNKEDLRENLKNDSYPKILKTNRVEPSFNKKMVLYDSDDIEKTDSLLETGPCIIEPFDKKALNYYLTFFKTEKGEVQAYPIIHSYTMNRMHTIYTHSTSLKKEYRNEMIRVGRELAVNIEFVGTLTIKMGISGAGTIYLEEIQSRIPEFARITNDFFNFSIYEAQVKTMANLPLPFELKNEGPSILIPLTYKQLLSAYKEMEQKTNWRFHFYPKMTLNDGNQVGYINVPVSNFKDTTHLLSKSSLFK